MISTTTQMLLIQEKLSLLESYVGWTIGGVTLTITVLIALFLGLSFAYQIKFQKEELKNLDDELTIKINKKLEEKKTELQVVFEQKIKEVEDNLEQKISIQEADLARNYANTCAKNNLPGIAFKWWLSAAAKYSRFSDKEKIFNLSIKRAKYELEKASGKSEIDDLIEYGDRIAKDIEEVRLKAKTQADLLESLFKKKIGNF